MLSADAPSHRARPYIWIKLATAMDDVFAHLEFFDLSTDISDVASLACSSFSHWQLDAGQVRIYMVAKAGEPKPTSSDIDNALLKEPLKITAPVESGAWLVAKPTQSIRRWLSLFSCFRPREETSLQLRLIIALDNALLKEPLKITAPVESGACPRKETSLQLRLIIALERTLALAEDRSFAISVLSDPQYEKDARNWLPSQLLQRCGLVVIDKGRPQRTNLKGLQWGAPVLIAQTEPHPNLKLGEFEIFPSETPFYHRPKRVDPRRIAPTKLNSSDDIPPSAHYFALFEISSSTVWAMRLRRKGDDTLKTTMTRLNERLAKMLDRAKEESFVCNDARITDLVAVVGIVAPTSCKEFVSTTMSNENDVPLLLKEMMDAKRFVVFIKPNIGHSHSSMSSPSMSSPSMSNPSMSSPSMSSASMSSPSMSSASMSSASTLAM